MLKFWNILLVVSLGIYACCPTGKRKTVWIEDEIEYERRYASCLFFTPEVGLLGGEKEGNACCWKTTDSGRHWQQKKLAGGVLKDLTEQDGVVYATVERREKDTLLYTHSVYTSCDQGESWQLKCEMVTEEAFIDLVVLDSTRMFMVLLSSLLETQDGGEKWQIVRDDWCRKVSMDDKYLYYMIHRRSPEDILIDCLVRRSLKSGKERLLKFPAGVDLEETCGNVILLEKEQCIRSYRIEENMSLTFLGKLNQKAFSVDYMSRCGEQLFANLFIGISTQKLFYSPDGGVHWKYAGRSTTREPICMQADSTHLRIFISTGPYYLQSYTHKRIGAD